MSLEAHGVLQFLPPVIVLFTVIDRIPQTVFLWHCAFIPFSTELFATYITYVVIHIANAYLISAQDIVRTIFVQ